MTRFNVSEWALKHRSLTVYLMIVTMAAGLLAYSRLGRNEDPAFTFRTMVVQAAWPGATLNDTLDQVTDRLERTLKETPSLDFLRSFTRAGSTTIFVNLKGSTPPADVPDIWYHVRKSVADMRHTLPKGIVGPGFNDEFGDTFGIIYGFTADGFTHRELRDHAERIRKRLLRVADVSKVEILGAQDERVFVEFSTKTLAGLGIDRAALIAALQAQNAVSPAGALQTGDEKLALRVTGAFESEQDILDVNIASNGRLIRLRDIADVRRGYVDPPQPMFRVNGKPAIGVAIAMREGGDILALGRNIQPNHGRDHRRPADRHRADPRGRSVLGGPKRDRRIHDLAVAGDRHHHGGERRQPRRPRRRDRRPVDSAHARDRVPGHAVRQHRPAAHLPRRADHRADAAGRRRHEHDRRHDHAACAGRREGKGGDLRLSERWRSRC